jgi:hypothetical protein
MSIFMPKKHVKFLAKIGMSIFMPKKHVNFYAKKGMSILGQNRIKIFRLK